MQSLRRQLETLCREWIDQGLPSREQIVRCAQTLIRWKEQHSGLGLWPEAPLLMTATLDDGIGQGIEIIHLFAEALGMRVMPLGLLQPADAIVAACRQHCPAFLGLTVLQLDSEEELASVGQRLPPGTCLIAGGPAFRYDPEMATRCGVHHVAANVAYFIDFLLQRAAKCGDGEIIPE
ncbi:MAG: cobalamin B12-binding domain-containing protein [Desulfatitalea sp.]